MPLTFTPRLGLRKPGVGEAGWNLHNDDNFALLDGMAALRQFAVRAATPSTTTGNPTTHEFDVSGGAYINLSGARVAVADFPTQTAPASMSTYVWLTSAGTLGMGAALPTGVSYAPLALVATDAAKITAITDLRYPLTLISG